MRNYQIFTLIIGLFLSMNLNAQIDRSVQPKAGPAPTVKVGQSKSFTLSNGLTVLVVENDKLPRVNVNLTIDNPPYIEGDKAGMSSLLGSMMGNGTSKISKDDFNEQIDFYGASVRFRSNGASASTLSRYFPNVLKLMAQGSLDPNMTQKDFDSEKEKALEGLRSQERNVSAVASNVQNALAYGVNHPFGEFMKSSTLNNVTLNDVKNFHSKYFVPNNAYLVIVGDVKFNEVEKLVKNEFKNWKKGDVKRQDFKNPANVTTTTINFVDMPNAVQSEIGVMGITNLKMTDPDYYAAMLANQILGGGGEGRLFLNLREAHGWTYGSYSSVGADKEVRKFMATAQVRNAVTDSAIVEILNEVNRIQTELVSEEELRNAKAKFVGNFVMQAEKPEVIASQALRTKTQGLPANHYENHIKNINAVTAEQVRAAARKYFAGGNARVVVVGKGSEVLPALDGMGMPVLFYDREGNPVERPAQTAVPVDVTPAIVLDRYLNAIGGANKAKAINTVKTEMTIEGLAPQPLTVVSLEMAPNKTRQTISMEGMTVMDEKFDGTTYRASGMGGNAEQTGDDVAERVARKGVIKQAFYTADQLGLTGIEKVDGKDAYVLRVVEGGKTIHEYYDVQSGLLVQQTQSVETPQGNMNITARMSDYKEVDGIKFPHVIVQEAGPQVMTMKVKNVTINKGVTAADFQ
ncbi:MAG: insulinase family protein [Weeksellaceae bacterium]|nr:insulinase family protein [Weeksellaceae bacterium]